MSIKPSLDDIYTIQKFQMRFPDVFGSETKLRYALKHRHKNGLDMAVISKGKKLYLIAPLVREWFLQK